MTAPTPPEDFFRNGVGWYEVMGGRIVMDIFEGFPALRVSLTGLSGHKEMAIITASQCREIAKQLVLHADRLELEGAK